MKIASWNVNSLKVRMPHLQQWLADARPDIVALQETKIDDERFPDTELAAFGYRSVFAGQKTYNGVALLSRTPAADVQIGIPGFGDEQKRVIAASFGELRVIDLYVVNGQDVGTDKYAYKLRWLEAVHDWLAAELRTHPKLVVLGDFNIAPEPRDVHDAELWNDHHILSSAPEREALHRLLGLGLHDAYRLHHDGDGQFSWWDYRQGAFRRSRGLRIDLTLISDALRAGCRDAGIDREPRTWERPSDHTPVWVELAVPGAA